MFFQAVILACLFASGTALAADSLERSAAHAPGDSPHLIVIGFVGGHVRRNDAVHGEVQLAKRLRSEYPAGVQVEIFENRRGDEALRDTLHFLDRNHDGSLSAEEKRNARIAIYGHSWGASETVTLARALGREHIPVLLTVQVDSVTKFGEDDGAIPPNVAQAVNFYQRSGLLHGRSEIHADDSSRTQILGNFLSDYSTHTNNCDAYPWFARTFMRSHIEIESDPKVWGRVESLIRSKVPPAYRLPASFDAGGLASTSLTSPYSGPGAK